MKTLRIKTPLAARLIAALAFITLPSVFSPAKAETSGPTSVTDTIKFRFALESTVFDPEFGDNPASLETLRAILEPYRDSLGLIHEITFIGTGSPDGGVRVNSRMSVGRSEALAEYFAANFPDFASVPVRKVYFGRDYEGILRLAEADGSVPWHDATVEYLRGIIEKILADGADTDTTLYRLQHFKGGEPYDYLLENIFPFVRACRIQISREPLAEPAEPEPEPITEPETKTITEPAPEPEVITEPEVIMEPETITEAEPETITEPEPEPEPEPEAIIEPGAITEPEPEPVIAAEAATAAATAAAAGTKEKRNLYMDASTNMLYDLFLVPNLAAEFYLGKNFSVGADWMYSHWKSDRKNWYSVIYGGDLYVRYWLGKQAGEKPLTGHHLGLYGQTYKFDFEYGGKGHLTEAWNWGVGIEYGYSLPIAKRLNLDFNIGLGYTNGEDSHYYPSEEHYYYVSGPSRKHYFGPTRVGVTLVWLIGRGNTNPGKGKDRQNSEQ